VAELDRQAGETHLVTVDAVTGLVLGGTATPTGAGRLRGNGARMLVGDATATAVHD